MVENLSDSDISRGASPEHSKSKDRHRDDFLTQPSLQACPTRSIKDIVSASAEELSKRTPPNVSHIIKQAIPFMVCIVQYVELSIPYIEKTVLMGMEIWTTQLAPYHPEDALPMICGLILCFFGGSYIALIAAVEAFRITGYRRFKRAAKALWSEAKKAHKAAEADSSYTLMYRRQEITSTEYLAHSANVVLRAVDPEKATDALSALWAGFIAVIATLKVHFAQAVTLGAAIGDTLEKHTKTIAHEQIQALLPPEHHRWAPTLSSYFFRFMGVALAWMLHRIISAFHSSMRGGQMFAMNLALLLQRRGSTIQLSENTVQYIALATAGFGYLWQLSNNFSVPIPLNLLLLPVSILEYIITCCVHFI